LIETSFLKDKIAHFEKTTLNLQGEMPLKMKLQDPRIQIPVNKKIYGVCLFDLLRNSEGGSLSAL